VFFQNVADVRSLVQRRQSDCDQCKKIHANIAKCSCDETGHVQGCARKAFVVDTDGTLLHVTVACVPLRSNAECKSLSTDLDAKCDCDTLVHDHDCVHRTHVKRDGSVFKRRLRIVVPESLQPSVLYHFHGAGGSNHLGIAAMKNRVKEHYEWYQ